MHTLTIYMLLAAFEASIITTAASTATMVPIPKLLNYINHLHISENGVRDFNPNQ